MNEKIVLDATNTPLGRVSAYAAKQALLGKDVIIVNCEKAQITGRRRTTISEYKEKRQRGGSSLRGPHFPKQAERVVKRTIRGMLPYTQSRGLTALKKIICYDAVPAEYASAKMISIARPLKTKAMSLADLEREI